MQRIYTSILFLCLLLEISSCSMSNNITGTYQNKFAILGFFGTTIRLFPDSTLQYVFQGDLMYDSITGHYQVFQNKLYLNFDKEARKTDKSNYQYDDMPLKQDIFPRDTIQFKISYYIGHNKLFPIHFKTGDKITKERKYNKRKKYLLFGSHYYNKRYYLKKIE